MSGYLFVDIANAFAKEYDEVVLMAGTVNGTNQPLDEKVKIVKIKKYNKETVVKRSLSWLIAFIQVFFLVKLKYRKYELFICSNPPLAGLLPVFCSNPTSLLIYDIYPDGLVAGKFVSASSIIVKQWARWNKIAYKRANKIITLTNGMANLIAQYVDRSCIDVIPAWAIDVKETAITENEFVKAHHLEGKFLVVYSGNLGMGYDIESLVHLANYMKGNKAIEFLIVGEGWKKKIAEELVEQLQLTNCRVLPQQPSHLFIHLMKAMHLGVVSLAKEASKIAIPSKTYNILGNSKPLLCIGDKDSELAALTVQYSVGAVFSANEIEPMAKFVAMLALPMESQYKLYCANAKNASLHYTSRNAATIAGLVKN